MNSETDVIIVGAGAAGLGAATRLRELGVRFTVLEARTVAGGRTYTESATLGHPFDHGGHWLHSASLNPLRQIADSLKRRYFVQPRGWGRHVFVSGRLATTSETAAYVQTFENAFAAIRAAGVAGRDVAAREVIDTTGPWYPGFELVFSLITSGATSEVSVADMAAYVDTEEDFPVEEGLGALIATHAAGIEVECATPVNRIDWSGRGVRVETDRGTLHARAAVVTASTNVLAAGGIRFFPELPLATAEALAACPLGSAEKIAFLLDRPLDGFGPGSFVAACDPATPGRVPVNFYCNPFGRPIVAGHVGGPFAAALERAGPEAMVDHALAALVDIFGAAFPKRIRGTLTTHWTSDPFIRGGYSFARPGAAHLRARLSEPIGDRIFLAGEAVSSNFFSTAHGAHVTGLAAAERASQRQSAHPAALIGS